MERRDGALALRDSPGCFWLLGGLFCGVGALFVAMPLGLASDAGQLSAFQRGASAALGLIGLVAGGYIFARNPASSCTFDRRAGALIVRRRWPLAGTGERYPLAEIVAARVEEGRDDEGGVTCRPQAVLRSGAAIALSRLWSHDRAGCQRAAAAVNAFLAGAAVDEAP